MRDNKYIQVLWVEDDPMITFAHGNFVVLVDNKITKKD